MCNLYSVTKPQAAIRQLAKAMADLIIFRRFPVYFPMHRAHCASVTIWRARTPHVACSTKDNRPTAGIILTWFLA
jgi:hypothetical protein